MDQRDVAFHEYGHKVVAERGGLWAEVDGASCSIGSGDTCTQQEVYARQVASMAGNIAQERAAREQGREVWDGASGDRAEFVKDADWYRGEGAKVLSMGQARAQAERMVNRHWGQISAEARRSMGEQEASR